MASCPICNDLRHKDEKDNDWPWVGEFLDIRQLQASAQNGCFTCSLLRDGLIHCVPKLLEFEGVPIRIGEGAIHSERLRPFLVVNVGLGWEHGAEVEFFRSTDEPCPWTAIGTASKTLEDTGSDESFQYATEWLRNCMKQHKMCNSGPERGLPTRILDLGGPGEDPVVKLYESHNEIVRYMCLSHCWGKSVSLTTETTTLNERKEGILWSELPRTFQDAITVTRRLGIQYLWIDSLCILQDSVEDWENEASKMASVYQGSFLTIAASKSAGSNEGCFAVSVPEHKTLDLSGNTKDSKPYSIHVRKLLPHWVHLSTHFRNFPLLSRGWVYQERLLSPRVLHFGSRELIWECVEQTRCECIGTHERGIYTHPKMDHGEVVRSGKNVENLAWRWRQMIMEYTSLKLTRVTDLLPALAGIVEEMQAFRDGKYLAGLWEDTLVSDLCWSTWDYYAHNIAETAQRLSRQGAISSAWRAPTWSWASTEAIIEYSDVMNLKEQAKVLEVECLPQNPGFSFGLAWGCVVALGQMSAARIEYIKRPMPPRGDVTLVYDLELQGARGKGPYYFLPDYDFSMAHESDGVGPGAIVHCLKMGITSTRVYTLVLRCVDEADQMFKRVGLVTQQINVEGFVDWYDGSSEESVVRIC